MDDSSPSPTPSWFASPILVWASLLVAGTLILRTAWVSDDAYMTLRTVDNLLAGHGLVWNVGERVQAYTHPLWMLLLVAPSAVSDNAFLVVLLVSIAVSLVGLWVIATKAIKRPAIAAWAIVALVMSRSFIDYSTSGLENPLSHLLLALLFFRYARFDRSPRSVTILFLLGALLATTRLDLVLLIAPALGYAAWRVPVRTAAKAVVVGLSPLFAWELFSLVYYGTLIPTSALSKLLHDLPRSEVWRQGLAYLVRQIEFDPLSLVLMLAAVVFAFKRRAAGMRWLIAASGICVYVLYVVEVGGDFMAGRFFSAPTVAAVCILANLWTELEPKEPIERNVVVVYATTILLGLFAETPTPKVDSVDKPDILAGIVDERRFWGRGHMLVGLERSENAPYSGVTSDGLRTRRSGKKVVIRVAVGIFAYHAGPDVYVIDPHGLGDAFLARLPAVRFGGWRVGHYYRALPIGYKQTIETGENRLIDPDLVTLYDQVRLVTHGPLFGTQRWAAIWKLNTGQLDDLVDADFYKYPYYEEVPQWALADKIDNGFAWNGPGTLRIDPDKGLSIRLPKVSRNKRIKVAVDHNDAYIIRYELDGKIVGVGEIKPIKDSSKNGIQQRRIDVPEPAQETGYDTISLQRKGRHARLSIGHLILVEPKSRRKSSRSTPKPSG